MISQSERNSKAIRFSLEVEGKEIGRAWLCLIRNDLHAEPYGLLEDVWINESHRGKGFASQLVKEVMNRAKQEGCYKLVATSRLEREKVHRLYVCLGFELHGHEFRIDI